MSVFHVVNNVNTTLAGGISAGAISLTLSSSANLPTLAAGEVMALTLNDAATQSVFEIVYVGAIAGAVCSSLQRGQEGTTAQSWLAGDFAYSAATKGVLDALGGNGTLSGNGHISLGSGLTLQWATVTSVPADGSALVAVSFPVAFANACFVVQPAIKNAYQTNPWQLSVQYDTPTTTGFNVNVSGASPGISATVAITYIALGN